jgi:hypothetical protein
VQRKLQAQRQRKRGSFGETALLLLSAVCTFFLAAALHNRGIHLKWVTAIAGTAFTFGAVIYICRQMLRRWAFWVALAICFAAHVIMVWIFFQFLLSGVERFSILLWYPIMMLELFVLLIAVKRIHDKLTGTHEMWELKS